MMTKASFFELAKTWHDQTDALSSLIDTVLNENYQFIIGMGDTAITNILRELRDHGGHWFWALTSITGEDIAKGAETYDEAREAWLNWGVEEGYIRDKVVTGV